MEVDAGVAAPSDDDPTSMTLRAGYAAASAKANRRTAAKLMQLAQPSPDRCGDLTGGAAGSPIRMGAVHGSDA